MGELVDLGEQFERKYIIGEATKPANVTVGLFDNSTDTLSDTSDIGGITTELDSSLEYSRIDIPFDTTGFSAKQPGGAGTDWQYSNDNEVTFQVSDNSGTIDSYFVIVNFQADGDESATDHLYFFGDLSQTYSDITDIDELRVEVDGIGLGQD